MENNKNYVGKVIKVYYTASGKEQTETGIVLSQRVLSSGKPQMNMLLTDGNEWLSTYVKVDKITSARIDETLRAALTQYYKARVEQEIFLNKFREEKAAHEQNVSNALRAVRDTSGTMSYNEFTSAVENLFKDTFPHEEDHSGWYKKYFHCSGGSQTEIQIDHVKDIEKYARPEQYPFIRRLYDDNLTIEPNTPGFQRFCERNAPAEIPALKGKCKSVIGASIGDKWLTVKRTYKFPLVNGYSKQSLQALKELLCSPAKSKLDDRIAFADKRKAPDEEVWDEAQRIGEFLRDKYELPLDVKKEPTKNNAYPPLSDMIASATEQMKQNARKAMDELDKDISFSEPER